MSSNTTSPLTYDQAGVNYDLIDPLKVTAQRAAAATAANLAPHGFTELQASRGESAYVVDVGPFYLASIVECLGSKALVADEMKALTGKSYYDGIAQDTIAMAVNDLIMDAKGGLYFTDPGPRPVVAVTQSRYPPLVGGVSPAFVLECVGAEGMLMKATMHVAPFGKIVSLGFCTSPDPVIPGVASYKCAAMQFAVGYSMKEFIYIAVSVANKCEYCIHSHTAAARAKGMTEDQYGELLAVTDRLKFLVAFRPALLTPTLAAQMASTYQRVSNGRLLVNIVTGAEQAELARFGVTEDKATRYARTAELVTFSSL